MAAATPVLPIGSTPQLITGVWAGRDSDKPMTRVAGGSVSNHLWKKFMEEALASAPAAGFAPPPLFADLSVQKWRDSAGLDKLMMEQERAEGARDLSLARKPLPATQSLPPIQDPRQAFGGWETVESEGDKKEGVETALMPEESADPAEDPSSASEGIGALL